MTISELSEKLNENYECIDELKQVSVSERDNVKEQLYRVLDILDEWSEKYPDDPDEPCDPEIDEDL